jgi:hypothetical protein
MIKKLRKMILSIMLVLTFLLGTITPLTAAETTTQTSTPQEDMPYIRVLTPFPEGTVTNPTVDIEYIAVPSTGARIEAVYYHINNVFHNYVYLAENNIRYQHPQGMGTLGNARAFIIPGENRVEFFALDTHGRIASFAVAGRPRLEIGSFPNLSEIDHIYVENIDETQGFITNNLFFSLVFPDDHITIDDISEIVSFLDGVIIGSMFGIYLIELPAAYTHEELLNLAESLENEFPNFVEEAFLNRVSHFGPMQDFLDESMDISIFNAKPFSSVNEGSGNIPVPFVIIFLLLCLTIGGFVLFLFSKRLFGCKSVK